MGEGWRLGHRPALDGLRGIAILLVMAAHAEVPGFAGGGWVGVTLFFVLSGFLITSLLVEEVGSSGHLSFARFYARRGLRLLPALAALILFWTLIDTADGAGSPIRDALAATFYVANFFRAAGIQIGPLNHTWSLAIEEQFYLTWPLVLLLVWRLGGWRPALAICAGLGALVIAWRFALADAPVYRAEFGTDTRADAILFGCALALLFAGWRPVRPPTWLGTLAIAGLFALSVPVAAAFFYRAGLSFAVALGLVAVAWLAHDDGTMRLGWRPLAFTGRISYGLYLWHFPIMYTLSDRLADVPVLVTAPLFFALSFAAALVSWRYLEQPVQRWGRARIGRPARPIAVPLPTPATPLA